MSGLQRGRVVSFVLHAMPEVDPQAMPSEWVLTPDGIEAATGLHITPGAQIVSSPEAKALQTVALATGTAEASVAVDPSFREVDRTEVVHAGYRAARRAWVSGALDDQHQGWESPEAVASRISDGLLRYDAPCLVVGTHGMALTAWLVSTGVVKPHASAVAFWERLPFPAVVTVELMSSGRASLRA